MACAGNSNQEPREHATACASSPSDRATASCGSIYAKADETVYDRSSGTSLYICTRSSWTPSLGEEQGKIGESEVSVGLRRGIHAKRIRCTRQWILSTGTRCGLFKHHGRSPALPILIYRGPPKIDSPGAVLIQHLLSIAKTNDPPIILGRSAIENQQGTAWGKGKK